MRTKRQHASIQSPRQHNALRLGLLLGSCVAVLPVHASPAVANVVVELVDQVDYYDVYARRIDDLYAQIRVIRQLSGQTTDASGLTLTEMRLLPRIRLREGRCRLTDAQIQLSIRLVLPRWQPGSEVPNKLRDVWRRTERLVTEHEQQHRQNALDTAADLQQDLEQLSPTANCREMDLAVSRAFSRQQQRRSLRDQSLDRRYILIVQTNHRTKTSLKRRNEPPWR